MESLKLYRAEVLGRRVPALHPRYQWMEMELEPGDRVVLTSINGHNNVQSLVQLTGLPEETVVRVILKLFSRGLLLFDDPAPFLEEEAILKLVPTFDPKQTNLGAHLDETDRRLLAFIDGRTPVLKLEGSFGFDRERLLASVIRLQLAGVIGFASVSPAASPPPTVAPQPIPSEPALPAPVPPDARSVPQGGAGETPHPRARQEKFEEHAQRILETISSQTDADLEAQVRAQAQIQSSAYHGPQRGSGRATAPVRERSGTVRINHREARPEPRPEPANDSSAALSSSLTMPMKIGALLALLVVGGVVLSVVAGYHRGAARAGRTPTPESFQGIIDLTRVEHAGKHTIHAWVAPAWDDLSEPEKRGAVNGMIRMLKPEGVNEIFLLDAKDRKVAIWTNDRLVLF